jgi:hypothetical protein
MARNKSKYFYIELAIVRGSPLFHALLEDAATSGKPAALVAVQRLADYHKEPPAPALAEDDAGEWEYRAEQARANALAALHALETWE